MATTKRSGNFIIVIGLAVFLVVAAIAILVLQGDDDGNGSTAASGGDVPVLVAKKAIARGTQGDALTADLYEVKQVPPLTRLSDSLVSPTDLAGKAAIADIAAGEQLRSVHFRNLTLRNNAFKIPDGMQAVPVTVEFTPAGAGYVGPGDRVNVYGLYKQVRNAVGSGTEPGSNAQPNAANGGFDPNGPLDAARLILPNVQVLDVSQEIAPVTAQPVADNGAQTARLPGNPPITYLMALPADQAEKLIYFTSYNSLYLTLLPKDQAPSSTGGRTQADALRP